MSGRTTTALFAVASLITVPAHAGDSAREKRQVLRPHGDSSRKFDIIENGERVGSIRIDKDGEKAKIRDTRGNVEGVIRKDSDEQHSYEVYGSESSRKPIGRLERQDDHHKRYDIEDANGKKIGEMRPRHGRHEGEYVIEYE